MSETEPITGEVVREPGALTITPKLLKSGAPNIIVRDEKGRIVSGALNPGGQSYKRLIRQVLKDELEKGMAEPVAKELLRLTRKAKHESTRIAAITTVIEHTEGKAVQALAVQHSLDENTMKCIAELSQKLLLE